MQSLLVKEPFSQQYRANTLAKSDHWRRWTGVIWHAIVIATILAIYFIFDKNAVITLAFGGAACAITYIWLGLREARQSSLWLTPLSFYFFWYSVGLGLSAIYVSYTISIGTDTAFAAMALDPGDVAAGYLVYLLGTLCLHCGFQIFRPLIANDSVSYSKMEGNTKVRLGILIALWVVGILLATTAQFSSAIGATAAIFRGGLLASLTAFLVSGREQLGLSRFTYGLLLSIGFSGFLYNNILSGSKAHIMFTFLPLVWASIMFPKWRKALFLIVPILAMVYLFVVFPIVMESRRLELKAGETEFDRVLRAYEMSSETEQKHITERFLENVDAFFNRQFDASATAFLIGDVRSSGHAKDDFVQRYLIGIVPRILWPDKPVVTRGDWFAKYTGIIKEDEESGMSLGISAIGDWYWVFGLGGVIMGMLGIGMAFGYLWRMAGENPLSRPLGLLLYCNLFFSMIDQPDVVTVLVSITLHILLFKGLFLLIDITENRSAQKHAI